MWTTAAFAVSSGLEVICRLLSPYGVRPVGGATMSCGRVLRRPQVVSTRAGVDMSSPIASAMARARIFRPDVARRATALCRASFMPIGPRALLAGTRS